MTKMCSLCFSNSSILSQLIYASFMVFVLILKHYVWFTSQLLELINDVGWSMTKYCIKTDFNSFPVNWRLTWLIHLSIVCLFFEEIHRMDQLQELG